jgi:hypothetical protein
MERLHLPTRAAGAPSAASLASAHMNCLRAATSGHGDAAMALKWIRDQLVLALLRRLASGRQQRRSTRRIVALMEAPVRTTASEVEEGATAAVDGDGIEAGWRRGWWTGGGVRC